MIELGDLMHVSIRGRLHGQRVINTLWYYSLNDIPDTEEVDMAGIFATEWVQDHGLLWPVALSNELVDLTCRAQLIRPNGTTKPTRWVYQDVPLTQPVGSVVEQALPSSIAAVFRRRTARAGKEYRGRVYIPGIPVSYEDDSRLTQAGYDALTASVGVACLAQVLAGGGPWRTCITDAPLHSRITEVTTGQLDDVLRIQRRREIGVGE